MILQGSGLLMSSQSMAQARRTRLKRALTEVTSDTVTYVKTVGNKAIVLIIPTSATPVMAGYKVSVYSLKEYFI